MISKLGTVNSSLEHCLSCAISSYCAKFLGSIVVLFIKLISKALSVISGPLSVLSLLSMPVSGETTCLHKHSFYPQCTQSCNYSP